MVTGPADVTLAPEPACILAVSNCQIRCPDASLCFPLMFPSPSLKMCFSFSLSLEDCVAFLVYKGFIIPACPYEHNG